MTNSHYATVEDWIAHEAISFSLDASGSLAAAVDKLAAALVDSVELLALGEPLHGGEEFLILRNRLFQRLVETNRFSAIAVESSFPRGHLVNQYIAGRGPASYDDLQETGFSHGFGRLEANRELVEWMRAYNADSRNRNKVQFYGFDSPTEMTSTDSPRQLLHFVLDYFTSIDGAGQDRRDRIDSLFGEDSVWENPAAVFDASKSIGASPAVMALRIETEDLISELHIRRPELVAASDPSRYLEAAQYAALARQMLNYHAAMARASSNRLVELLSMRDAMMADNLAYMVRRERGRVLAFAHNGHLKYRKMQWQLGPELLAWWPAGAQLKEMFGPRYAVIGAALGVSDANGIGPPEAGTLEAHLIAAPGPARFIPTHQGHSVSASAIAALATRSGSTRNLSYFPLTPQSLADFDWLAVLDSTAYNRGGPSLP